MSRWMLQSCSKHTQQLTIGCGIGVDLESAKRGKQAGDVQAGDLFSAVVNLPVILQMMKWEGISAVTAPAAADTNALLIGTTVIPHQMDTARCAERVAIAC